MDAILRRVRLLWRAERLVAEIRLAALFRRLAFVAVALVVLMFGLAMLNVAAFFALAERLGQAWGALAVAGGDFVLAMLALLLGASGGRTSRELRLATEMRDATVEALEADAAALARSGIGRFIRDPMGALPSFAASAVLAALSRAWSKKEN